MKNKFTDEQKQFITEKADAILEAVKSKESSKAESLKSELEKYVQDISSKLYEQQQAQPEPQTEQPQSSTSNDKPDAEDVTFEEVK